MRILIFGRTGQVATDLSDPAACAKIIAKSDADVVINAAAYTDVDGAETDTDKAYRVNSDAPGAMAQAAAKRALPFVHISTDYVFDGSGTAPWSDVCPWP